ncbi:hypothetical protein NDK25_11970 [Niallia taxi]|nr:hypothetical protein [Niallia taxi]MDE5052948.1 hypothetical protein [Niallia taxi]
MINQLSKYLKVPLSLVTFTLISFLTILCFWLFNVTESIGQSVGKLLYLLSR